MRTHTFSKANELIPQQKHRYKYVHPLVFTDDEMPDEPCPHDLGAQFTEIFIKKSDNVGLVLSLMEVCLAKIALYYYVFSDINVFYTQPQFDL